MISVNMLVSVYYNVILGLSIFYLMASFTSRLPWADCGHWWNQACSLNTYGKTYIQLANYNVYSTTLILASFQLNSAGVCTAVYLLAVIECVVVK